MLMPIVPIYSGFISKIQLILWEVKKQCIFSLGRANEK